MQLGHNTVTYYLYSVVLEKIVIIMWTEKCM